MSTVTGGAFGAGKAGGPFDPIQYVKKPQVILRLLSVLFSIVVFGCISSGGWYNHQCIMNGDGNACRYGTVIGVLAFLICLGFLVIDAFFDNLSSIPQRKYAVLADLGISALWTFLWFVGFCYMADAWRRTDDKDGLHRSRDNVQAAIAFSFFSIGSWLDRMCQSSTNGMRGLIVPRGQGALTFFAFRRYRLGSQEAFASGYDHDPNASSPYSSFPGSDTGDPYQQPPFSQQKETPDYQQPTY